MADLAEAELELLSMLVENALSSRHKLSHTHTSKSASNGFGDYLFLES